MRGKEVSFLYVDVSNSVSLLGCMFESACVIEKPAAESLSVNLQPITSNAGSLLFRTFSMKVILGISHRRKWTT
jgi:hypothetical protein